MNTLTQIAIQEIEKTKLKKHDLYSEEYIQYFSPFGKKNEMTS